MDNLSSFLSSQPTGVNMNMPSSNTTAVSNINNLFGNALLQPKHRVQQVNDEKEIYQIAMGVDSSDFILHATKPLIFFVATDSSGNKTSIIPFDIQQHVVEPEPTMQDVKNIELKIEKRLDSFKNEMSELITKKIDEALN